MRVPRYSTQVRETGLPGAKLSTDAPVEAFGGGRAAALPDQGVQAITQSVNQASELFVKEQKKANETRAKMEYSELIRKTNDLRFNPQTGLITYTGEKAFGAIDTFRPALEKNIKEVSGRLSNAEQRQLFEEMAANLSNDFDSDLNRHVAVESRKFYGEQMKALVSNLSDDAVLNYAKPGKVDSNLAEIRKEVESFGARVGMGEAERKRAVLDAESATRAQVVERMIAIGQEREAEKYFATAKKNGQITAEHAEKLDSKLESALVVSKGLDAWEKVQRFRLADGSPDEARMRSAVMGMNVPERQKERVWDFVKGKATETESFRKHRLDAADRSFMNEVITARKAGKPIEEALRIASLRGYDPNDRALKTKAVRDIYAPPTDSDMGTWRELRQGIENGSVDKSRLDDEYKRGRLNVTDWRSMNEKLINGGGDASTKLAWKRVEQFAKEKLARKEDQDAFIYALNSQADGKTGDEILRMAKERLEKDPSSGTFSQDAYWETDLKRSDAERIARGQVENDLGRDVVSGILQGRGKKGTIGDVDKFASQLGGYDAIKPGTRTHDAMRYLLEKRQRVTPANVKAVLEHWTQFERGLK